MISNALNFGLLPESRRQGIGEQHVTLRIQRNIIVEFRDLVSYIPADS